MKQREPVSLLLGSDPAGNLKSYNWVQCESRGIALSAVTRSGKSTTLFELKREIRKKIPDAQIVSIARDKDEFRQRDEIPFVIVGNRGEIPIDPKLAKQLGENTRKNNLDLILDYLSLPTEKEQDEEVSQFLTGLQMDSDERFWERPCFLFIDEVQILCKSGSTAFPKSREAIVQLAATCLKKNIIPIIASHKMKDFYINARDEITNHMVGYLDNIDQQEFACELLKLPASESKIIDGFGEGKGMFYVRGYDICKQASIIQVKATKLYPKGEVKIPNLSLEDRQRADVLRQSLDLKENISLETKLRFDNTSLQSKVDELSETQMTENNIIKFREEGYKIGYNNAITTTVEDIEQSRPSGILGKIIHGPKITIILKDGWRKKLVLQ